MTTNGIGRVRATGGCVSAGIAGLLVAIHGCSPAEAPPLDGGTAIVYPDSVPVLRLVPERTIGDTLGGTELGGVMGLAVDERGDLYVADRVADGIRVFDSAGSLLRTIGRAGAGPGEFRSTNMLAVAGDTLYVRDSDGVLEAFSRDGRFVRSLTIGPALARAMRMTHTRAGLVLVGFRFKPGSGSTVHRTFDVRLANPSTGEVTEPILEAPFPRVNATEFGAAAPVGSPIPQFAAAADGRVFTSDGDPFTITVVSPRGDTLEQASAVVPRVPSHAPTSTSPTAPSCRPRR